MSNIHIQLLLVVYVIGCFLIGVPLGIWSLRAWRGRTGKENPSLRFLFPCNYSFFGHKMLGQGIYTYERGGSLLHMMVSETALLNGVYDEDTESRLTCARYVFVSALTQPLRCVYLLIAAMMILCATALWKIFAEFFPMLGGKLVLLFVEIK